MLMGPERMWPDTIADWEKILIQTGIIFGAVWGFFHAVVLGPLKKELAQNTQNCATNSTTQEDLKKRLLTSEFDRAALHEKQGELSGKVERNSQAFEVLREQRHQDQLKITEQLTRIESKLDVAHAFEKLGEQIVEEMRAREARERNR